MGKKSEKSQAELDPNTASSKKLVARAEKLSKKNKTGLKESSDKSAGAKSKVEDVAKESSSSGINSAPVKKLHLESSKGNIVYSWQVSAGTFGFNSYPTYDYNLESFQEEYLLGLLDLNDVRSKF